MIDERACVHPDARIGSGVSIGPFSLIEADVSIGAGCTIGSHVVVRSGTRLGEENRIYQFCSIGEDPQFASYDGEPTTLSVGNRNIIREYVTLNRGSPAGTGCTIIGDDNFLMAYVHIAHDSMLGNHTIFANGASLAGHVEVGDFAILGGFTLVHQFCRLGAHCLTGIGTVCLKDVPPFVMANGSTAELYGINTRGLRRRAFNEFSISSLKRAYKLLFRSGKELNAALDELEPLTIDCKEIRQLVGFIRSSRRGLIR